MPGFFADYGRVAFQAVEDIERAATPSHLMGAMASAIRQFGYTQFLLGMRRYSNGKVEPNVLVDGWDPRWHRHYVKSRYFADDPVVARATRAVDPFDWADLEYDKGGRAQEIMNVAREFGLKHGYSVPIVRETGTGLVTMAGEEPEFTPSARRAIHLISLYAHAKAMTFGATASPTYAGLTRAECEVLSWAAAGKSTWDISMMLGISESAVTQRFARAQQKLNAVNRTQAVVNAIRAKAIRL